MKSPRSLRARCGLAITLLGIVAALVCAPHGRAQITPVPLPPFQLVNLSARAKLGAGQTLVAGFVVAGNAPARILVRGIGPSLAQFGVTDAMPDPKITLTAVTASGSLSIHNDNWSGGSELVGSTDKLKQVIITSFEGGAFPLLVGSKDAAMLFELSPGAYTVTVAGNTDTMTGTVLAEVYDINPQGPAGPRLSNLSVMGFSSAESPLLAGLVTQGIGINSLLLRAVGPGLTAFGVAGAMADSRIELLSARGETIAFNDNWDATPGGLATVRLAAQKVGAFPLNVGSKDAAMVVMASGVLANQTPYTVRASGVGGASGLVLLEVYDTPSLLDTIPVAPSGNSPVIVSPTR